MSVRLQDRGPQHACYSYNDHHERFKPSCQSHFYALSVLKGFKTKTCFHLFFLKLPLQSLYPNNSNRMRLKMHLRDCNQLNNTKILYYPPPASFFSTRPEPAVPFVSQTRLKRAVSIAVTHVTGLIDCLLL